MTAIVQTTASRLLFLDSAGPVTDPTVVGHKAATLAALAHEGFPVPPGFVLPPGYEVEAFTDAELNRAVDALGGFPVAVRSSGVAEDLEDASFAGQYETFLDVRDVPALRTAVADCRESAHNARVTAYSAARGVDVAASCAVGVLVQRLVDARTAGVAFTIDPLTGREEHAVIECCAGLGEKLVSGHVTPTSLTVRLADAAVVSRTEGTERVILDDDELAALTSLLLRVQAARHRPQDVEFAVDTVGMVWLLQSRPITALSWRTDLDQHSDADLRDGGVSARVCTTLMFSLYRNAFQYSMTRFWSGIRLLDPAAEPDWMTTHYGRVYWNVSAVKRCYDPIPGYDEEHFDRDLGVNKEYGPEGPRRTPFSPATVLRALPVLRALGGLYASHLEEVRAFADLWPAQSARWSDRVARFPQTPDPEFAADLVDCLLTFHARTERTYFTTIYVNTSVQSDLKSAVSSLDAATGATTPVIDLMGGLAEVSHMALQHGIVALHRVAVEHGTESTEFDAALDRFLVEHGFHADRELDLTCPRWSEEPDRVRHMIRSMIDSGSTPADPGLARAEQRRRHDEALADVRRRVVADPIRRVRYSSILRTHVRRMRRYLLAREEMRDYSSRCYAIVRAYVLEAGRRLHAAGEVDRPDDVFHLTLHELADLVTARTPGAGLRAAISYRREMYAGYRDLVPPHELGSGIDQDVLSARGADGALSGLGCSAGVIEGTARVLSDLDQTHLLRPGDVLVTTFTDPGWTPALGLVDGVVTEVGGMLSHAAVIAREYGIPAVLNVAGATRHIRSGQRLRVDGRAGTVTVLEPPDTDTDTNTGTDTDTMSGRTL